MATISTFIANEDAGIPASGLNKAYVMRKRMDFSETPVTAADVVKVMIIPADTFVLQVITEVITAEGGACTATLGDTDGAAGWDADLDLNAAAGTQAAAISGTDANGLTGKAYPAELSIDLTMGHNTDAAVLDVYAICFDLNA